MNEKSAEERLFKTNSTPLRISVRQAVIDTCSETTMHAIPNILKVSNHIILRILWIVFFLVSASYCLYSIIQTFQTYFSYPSYISTTIVQEIPTKFPMVAFCNAKSVDYSKAATIAYITANSMSLYIPQFAATSIYMWLNIQDYVLRKQINNDQSLTAAAKKALGFQIEDMLVSCYFNYKACNSSDFTYFYNPLYGNCYKFNYDASNPNTISLPGLFYGLTLELFLGNPQIETHNHFHDGVLLSIINQTGEPFSQGDTVKAAGGAETDFIVNRNFITKLPAPWGSCLSSTVSSSYYNYITNSMGKSYSQQVCFQLCVQDQIVSTCGCANGFLPPPPSNLSALYCSTSTQTTCLQIMINTFGNTSGVSICQAACPFECSSIDYSYTSYRSLYPTTYYSNILYNYAIGRNFSINASDVPSAFTKVNIFYNSMQYLTTVQTAQMQVADLFSNFGGTLGLFLGMSFLTFAEFFELVFNFILLIIKFILTRKQNTRIAENDVIKSNSVLSFSDDKAIITQPDPVQITKPKIFLE